MEIGENEESLQSVRMELELLAREAGFPRDLTITVAQRVIVDPQPTALIDRERTDETAEEAARGIEPVKNAHRRGEVIALPGDVLSRNQVDRIDQAMSVYRSTSSASVERIVQSVGVAGMAIGLCALLAAYAATFYPRIAKKHPAVQRGAGTGPDRHGDRDRPSGSNSRACSCSARCPRPWWSSSSSP